MGGAAHDLATLLGEGRLPLAAAALAIARALGLLQILPLSNRLGLTGMHRTIIAAAFAAMLLPVLAGQLQPADATGVRLLLLGIKEGLVGFVLGVGTAVPFWAAETAGELIDQQRGSQGALSPDAAQAEQSGITATLFVLTITTIFVVGGGFHAILDLLAASYRVWPAGELAPHLEPAMALRLLGLLDGVLRTGLLLASPILVAMILAELALALLSRFAPQLNVFDLSLSVKGLVLVAGLPLYAAFLLPYLRDTLGPIARGGANLARMVGP